MRMQTSSGKRHSPFTVPSRSQPASPSKQRTSFGVRLLPGVDSG